MLVSLSGETKISNRYIKEYKKLGYKNIKQGDTIFVPVEKLTRQSRAIVDVKCDYCNKIIKVTYNNYMNSSAIRDNKYCCKKCLPKKASETVAKKNIIKVKCCYCGDESTIRKRKYKVRIKSNGKYSCPKCWKEKYKDTCLEKYGVDNTSKLPEKHEKIKKTCKEKYGNENYRNNKKRKETCIKKYNVENIFQLKETQDKFKSTCLERYGVENPSQNAEIFSKQQKRRYEIKKHKKTGLYYQGTYEKDFLDNYYDKLNITRIEPIEYKYKKKKKKYHSDFYIPEYNLIVEIKSSYTFEKYKEKNLTKEKECKKLGYNFIFVIDKNYENLEKKIFNILHKN